MTYPVFKRKYLSRACGVAAAALMLSAAPLYAQTTSAPGTSSTDPAAAQPSDTSATQSPSATGTSDSGSAGESGMSSGSSGTSTDMSSGASGSAETAASGSGTQEKVSSADRKMMRDLAQANLGEIETAKLAQEKSSNEEVKKFAQQMIDDHTKSMDQLQQIAQQKGVDLPTEPDAKHQALLKKMQGLSGDAFDRQYVAHAGMADHRQAHQLVSRASTHAKDSDLKALASEMQPTIAQHMKMAREMRQDVASTGRAGQSTGSSGSPDSEKEGDQAKDGAASSGSSDAAKGDGGK